MRRRDLLTTVAKGGLAVACVRYFSAGSLLTAMASPAVASSVDAAPANLPQDWQWLAGGDIPSVAAKPVLPTTITDGAGAKVTVTDVSRIIVGGDDVADILAALGLSDHVHAAPDNSVSAAGKNAPSHFRYSQSTSTEGLLSMGGTLFIGNNPQRHGRVAGQFRDAGTAAVVIDNNQSIPNKIREVARYVGAASAGETLANKVQQQLDQARSLAKAGAAQRQSPRIIAVTSSGAGGSNAVYGTGTALEDILATLDAVDVGVEMGLEGYSVKFSREGLLKANPDAIIMGEEDFNAWRGMAGLYTAFPTLAETDAGANNNVIVMPDELIKVGGVGVGAGALALAKSSLFSTSQQ